MKKLSIRLRITLWFSVVLIVIVALTYAVILSVSDAILQSGVRDSLIEAVEHNVDEIEFFARRSGADTDSDADLYLPYGDGLLEIDDDFLNRVNGVCTALYQGDGALLYGENPVSQAVSTLAFTEGNAQKVTVSGTVWYVYDRALTLEGLEGLWLRGTVSVQQEAAQLSAILRLSIILMPALLLLALLGGWLIAGRSLKPVTTIMETASQISRGRDLKKRIQLGPGRDELHQLAGTFNAMFDRLDAAFEAEQQFTSDASHELRTPMAVILAQCEYALDRDRTPEDYQNALRVIRRQGGRMTRLIDSLLVATRLSGTGSRYERQPVDFTSLVTALCRDLALAEERGITLTCQAQPDIMVSGSADLLGRLVTNLVSNAYRYGREDGHIAVTLTARADTAVLSVADDGIGIAAEQQEKVFQRFYQADPARAGAGTGLGLAIVRDIAAFHQGAVTLESQPGRGSTFTFTMKKI